jgi:aryl-alcohol dehydrogenase-like predicted oxidoreductase
VTTWTSGLPRRRLGVTGLTVTPLGLGLAALGRPAYITTGRRGDLGAHRTAEAMEHLTHTVLDLAFDKGIRYIDTARSYGSAEEFLASWLDKRRLGRDDITVGSKWGYAYIGEWALEASVHEIKDHSAPQLRAQLLRSLELLGNRLSLYQVHSATLDSGVLDDREVLHELAALGSRDLTVGLTVSGPRQGDVIRQALTTEIDGVNPFRCVQATWNPLEPSSGTALAAAHEQGWGVIIKEALANGRLTDQWPRPQPDPIRRVAAQLSAPTDQVALAAALAQPWADVVLTGAVTANQLLSNLTATSVALGAANLEELSAIAEQPADYWRQRAELAWS